MTDTLTMNRFTAQDKLECAEREVRYRKRVYAARVSTGRMTQGLADRQIALMEDIVRDYALAAEAERLL